MSKKTKSASLTVAMMIVAMLISKFLGMLRGVLLAAKYDISDAATAFSAASRIPLSFFDIVFASAILGCFIPVYNSFHNNDAKKKQSEFTSIYLNFLLLLTSIVAILGIIFSQTLIDIVAPGLVGSTKSLAVLLLRIMFPLIVFAAASYTLVGVLQSKGQYIVPAFISAVSNLLIIVYFIFFNDNFGIKGLAVAYTLSWFAQLLTLVVPVIKSGYKYKLIFNFKNEGFKTALKMTPSIMMGSWLTPMCLLISMRFATLTQIHGAVPSFEYAVNLFTVITGITTYGVCNYIFPKLSEKADNSDSGFATTCRVGLNSALLMTIPIAAAVFALAPQGVSVIYQRGSFDVLAAKQVTLILRSLVPGMIGFTLFEFLSRTFYALKKPVFCVISVISGIAVDLLLVFILTGFFDGKLISIGLGYSFGILMAGTALLIFSFVRIKGFFDVKYFLNIIKIIISGTVSGILMYLISHNFISDAFSSSFLMNIISSVIVVVIGVLVYFVLLIILKESTIFSLKKR